MKIRVGNPGARRLQAANVVAFVAMLSVNALANVLPLNGVNTGQVSDSYPNLFTPPGYVFAVWAAIYFLGLVFVAYQARLSQRGSPYLGRIGYLYALSCLINVAWLAVFHYSYGAPQLYLASVLVITLFLCVLITIYRRLGIGVEKVTLGEKLAIHAHFSVYLGWLSLATIAAVASGINVVYPGTPMGTQALATAAMLLVALWLTLFMIYSRRDALFVAVVVWASSGIAVMQQAYLAIYYAAALTAAAVAVALIAAPLLKKQTIKEYYLS